MRTKLLTIILFTVCLVLAGRTAATPGTGLPSAEPTPQPAQYLAAVMNDAKLGQIPPTPTVTPPISATVGISGAVYLNPRWVITQQNTQPVLYEVVLDAAGSMSYDFAGHGTIGGTVGVGQDTVGGTDFQCQPNQPSEPLPYTDTCAGGENAPWRHYQERRIYIAKLANDKFIGQMNVYDAMRIVAFSSDLPGMAVASAHWSSDKQTLKRDVWTLGSYQNDPYRTAGYASIASGLQKTRDLLTTAPAVGPNGQPYKLVVILLTGSVANVFLDGTLNTARDICGALTVQQALETASCQIGMTAAPDSQLRPISAMVDVANTMKQANPNLTTYVVGLANVDATGLGQVTSDMSHFYVATQPSLLSAVLDNIQSQVANSTCIPAGGSQWIDSVDAAHLPSGLPMPDDTVVGYTYIYQENSATPLFVLPIQRDPATDKISFLLPPPDASHPTAGIAPGTYEMMAYVGYKGDDQITRLYDWLINPNTLSGASRIRFSVTSAGLGGPIIPLDPLFLDLPPTAHVCP